MGPAIERAAMAGNQFWAFYYSFCEGFGRASWEIFANGFVRGIKVLAHHPFYFILVALSGLSFALAALVYIKNKKKNCVSNSTTVVRCSLFVVRWQKILIGIIIFVLTLLPFIFIKGNSLALRSLFVAIIGLAITIDGIVDLIPKSNVILPAVAGVLVFMFTVSGISELTDYRACSLTDREFALGLAPISMQYWLPIERVPSLLTEQNSFYVEHIASVTSTSFAITGAIRYLTGNLSTPTVKVIWDKDMWQEILDEREKNGQT